MCPGTNVITDPVDFVWTEATDANGDLYYTGTLELGEHTFDLNGETFTTRAYRQAGGQYSLPGPTMRMARGKKYVVRFHNLLPYEPPSPDHNAFKDPNITNLHTHGLHISPASPADDPLRIIEGQRGGDYVWEIPADHMGGLHWYHPHHHGATHLQVSGGAMGLIVIENEPGELAAEVDAMVDRHLALSFLDTGAAGTGGDTILGGSLPPSWAVNGTVGGAVCMPQNEWQHFRILLAHAGGMAKTVTVDDANQSGTTCEVGLLARDGVWRAQGAPKMLPTGSITGPASTRIDLAVRCQGDAKIFVDNNPIADVFVSGAGNPTPQPYDNGATWSPPRPEYLTDLSGVPAEVINQENINMGARTINGSKFDIANPTFTLNGGANGMVQEWTIKGAVQHPFHLHVWHLQTSGCGGDFEDGEFYDTITANCAVRFDMRLAYDAPTVMHCHVLAHEDNGAMGYVLVNGGKPAPTYPAGGGFSEYYELGAAPPPECTPTEASEVSCEDGVDNDCDGALDCDDTDCAAAAACAAPAPADCNGDGVCDAGESCDTCGDCAGATTGRPANRFCCGNGILEPAEGDGTTCDGNP